MTRPRPLGRLVNHDPESLRYLLRPAAEVRTVRWKRDIPVLDQGNLGSCTGNATVGVLGSEPFYATLPGRTLDEDLAVAIYSDAEKIDGGGGYPPEDDGSSGLSAAKAAKARGLISGYLHATSIGAAHTAIQAGAFIVGSNWYSSMDEPNRDGIVTIGGTVRGGHEYECIGYDGSTDLWEFVNSWGTGFGLAGRFHYSTASFTRLLSEQGDATSFVPITVPAPTPTPGPVPSPTSDTVTKTFTVAQAAVLDDWADSPHVFRKSTAAAKAWKASA